jgi:hypothetical protein
MELKPTSPMDRGTRTSGRSNFAAKGSSPKHSFCQANSPEGKNSKQSIALQAQVVPFFRVSRQKARQMERVTLLTKSTPPL